MAVKLPDLAKIDYTSLDFQSIIDLVGNLITDNPDYFTNIDDFQTSNAGKMTIELVSYVVDLLADRLDWVANELTLPTTSQKINGMNLMKLINYRFDLPKTASVTVTASISQWVNPFVIQARYSVPAKDLDGNSVTFELLNKDEDDNYIYESIGSDYEFDTGYQASPILTHNDLVFYQGVSHVEYYTMEGVDNEFVLLENKGIEEGSIRVWKVTRDINGNIVTKKELTYTTSFISPEAQTASSNLLPPYKIQSTDEDGAYIVFGEVPVVAIFSPAGIDEIMVWYRVTKGEVGSISSNSINYTTTILVDGENVQINFINSIAASGGASSETLEHAKKYGPLNLTTAEKTVNPQDFVILLQDMSTLMNSIAYGKSNEPNAIYSEYGYYIPPYETWIYPIFNKSGWSSFPTYCYSTSMKVGRPYVDYGPLDKELIRFETATGSSKILTKLKYYSHNNDYSNVKVSNLKNSVTFIPGNDYVIDLESREVTYILSGAIGPADTVLVQYYENDKIADYITINFATSDIQDIPRTPIYTGNTTYAWTLDTETILLENNISHNDYNYPTNDYYIDYENNKIVRNSTYPKLDSKASIGSSSSLKGGINNEFILNFDGLNKQSYNADHDFFIDTFTGWGQVGTGAPINYTIGLDYAFKISIDGGEYIEYHFVAGGIGTWLPYELAHIIWDNAVAVVSGANFSDSGATVFANSLHYPTSPILTFMSSTAGSVSSISLDSGTAPYDDLFSLPNLSSTSFAYGEGEDVDVGEVAKRCRYTLNTMGLCNGYSGQELPVSNEEKPEVYSKSNLTNPTAFILVAASTDKLRFTLAGTTGAIHDGINNITFTTVATNSPYDLEDMQDKLDLTRDMQTDIDNSIGAQDIVKIVFLRTKAGFYRVGFKLQDTGSTTITPIIVVNEPAADSCRLLFQFADSQSSADDNLVEAKISPTSDMLTNFYLRIELLGAFGHDAFIQCKANNALHNNTLLFLQFGDDQYNRGTKIFSRTLTGKDDLIEDGALNYQFIDSGASQNNEFNLNIISTPSSFTDGDYVIVIPAATYNISDLVTAINVAFVTADFAGNPTDISSFMVCEKQEGKKRIRIRMTDFDSSSVDLPDTEINDSNDATIGKKCIDKLGFEIEQKMSDNSTILLHYSGDWVSNSTVDQSEENSIKVFLTNKKLICQDYTIKDSQLTSFDVKGTVYCAKGFDREIIKNSVETNIQSAFKIDSIEFAESIAASNILKEINKVEGIDYVVIDYFGKDYQLYYNHINSDKPATIISQKPAEYVVERWATTSSFKITLDGCTVGGINYDGEYLIVVSNTWTDRDYTSLLDHVTNGVGVTGGLKHAIPLEMGKSETDLTTPIHIKQSSGMFIFYTENEGNQVMIKLENPDNILTKGYQSLNRATDILESEYTASSIYSIDIDINGSGANPYQVTSPASGEWGLSTVAAALSAVLPVTAVCGIDANGKIRFTSLLGGNQSTIDCSAGSVGIDLITLIGPTDTPVDGSHGYVTCLDESIDGSLYIRSPVTAHGLAEEPTIIDQEDMYNYRTEIPSKYSESLYVSDNYFLSGTTNLTDQRHGIILTFAESGSDNA